MHACVCVCTCFPPPELQSKAVRSPNWQVKIHPIQVGPSLCSCVSKLHLSSAICAGLNLSLFHLLSSSPFIQLSVSIMFYKVC